MANRDSIELGSGARFPTIGFGLWKIDPANTAEMVFEAIKAGYRHLDAACDYGNEAEAGIGIRRAIDEGLCSREELWITSKLWNTYHRPEHVRPAIDRSLNDLGLEYLDLYLMHFPLATKYVDFEDRYPPGWIFDPNCENPKMEPDSVPLATTWGAMESLQELGLTKHIGICNFGCSLIRDLLATAKIRPAVLQVESHPYLVQANLLRYCEQEGIAYTAFSPLGAGSYIELGMAAQQDVVLGERLVSDIAEKHGKTPAQVVLRWGVQRGTSVIPKTSRIERLAENIGIYDFNLTAEEMNLISGLDKYRRFNDPGDFCEPNFGQFFPIYD